MQDILKELRLSKELKQPQIAQLIGVSHRQFRRYENSECAVPLLEAVAWAKALGLTINQFVKLYK